MTHRKDPEPLLNDDQWMLIKVPLYAIAALATAYYLGGALGIIILLLAVIALVLVFGGN